MFTINAARNLKKSISNKQQEHGDAFVAIEMMLRKPEIMNSVVYHQGLPLPKDDDGNLDMNALAEVGYKGISNSSINIRHIIQ